MNRSVVFGGAGFIGQHIRRAEILAGNWVRVADRNHSPKFPAFQSDLHPPQDNVVGQFPDGRFIEAALEGVDKVYFCLSSTVPSSGNADPIGDVTSNLIGMLQLLKRCVAHQIKHFVFLSSGGTVYGSTENAPAREEDFLNPISSHGIVKAAIERYLAMYAIEHGLSSTILRIANPYGPGLSDRNGQGVINRFLSYTIQGKTISIYGDGSVIRDYLYIDDLTEGIMAATRAPCSGCQIYNLGSGRGQTLLEIVKLLPETTKRKPSVHFEENRKCDLPCSVLNPAKAQKDFGWSTPTSLREGMQRTADWILSRSSAAG